jgi:hypothetical protein
LVEIGQVGRVKKRPNAAEEFAKNFDWLLSELHGEILKTPAVFGFEDPDVMAPRKQFGNDTPQEMGIAVVPVGYYGVVKKGYAHYHLVETKDPMRRGLLTFKGSEESNGKKSPASQGK